MSPRQDRDRHHDHHNNLNEHHQQKREALKQQVIDSTFRDKLIELGMSPREAHEMGRQGISSADLLCKLDDIAMDELFNNTEAMKGLTVMTKYKVRALQAWLKEKDSDDDDDVGNISLSHFDEIECDRQMIKMRKKEKTGSRHTAEEKQHHHVSPRNDKMSRGGQEDYSDEYHRRHANKKKTERRNPERKQHQHAIPSSNKMSRGGQEDYNEEYHDRRHANKKKTESRNPEEKQHQQAIPSSDKMSRGGQEDYNDEYHRRHVNNHKSQLQSEGYQQKQKHNDNTDSTSNTSNNDNHIDPSVLRKNDDSACFQCINGCCYCCCGGWAS